MKPSWSNRKKFVWWSYCRRKRSVTEAAREVRITSNWKVLEIMKAGINQWVWISPHWRSEACNLLMETRNWNLTSKVSTTLWTITPSQTRSCMMMRHSMTISLRTALMASLPLDSTPPVWQRLYSTRLCSGSSMMPHGGRSSRKGFSFSVPRGSSKNSDSSQRSIGRHSR